MSMTGPTCNYQRRIHGMVSPRICTECNRAGPCPHLPPALICDAPGGGASEQLAIVNGGREDFAVVILRSLHTMAREGPGLDDEQLRTLARMLLAGLAG